MKTSFRHQLRSVPTFVCLLLLLSCVAWQQELNPPSFDSIPPQLTEFSNTSGARIPCSASVSSISTNVSWRGADGHSLTLIPGLREVRDDGALVLLPFKAEDFRQDVHATSYKCAITNDFGTIVSNDVIVKAVVVQPYDVYVYDVFAMKGSTAVLKCHVPKIISTYVTVTSWNRDSVDITSDPGWIKDSRFNVVPSGELYIQNVSTSDGKSIFGCQVTNKLTGESKTSVTSGKLFVTDPQGHVPPKISFSKKVIVANVGETAFLPCEAQAHPMPNTRWSRSSNLGKEITLSLKDRYSLVSGSLLIKDVHQSDVGEYTCTASNIAGSEKSEMQLVIKAQLVVNVNPTDLIVDNGKTAIFTCNVIGNPVTAIIWMKDGQPLSEMPSIELINNSSFRIIAVSSEHKGIYQCLVKNNYHEQFAVASLRLGDSPPILLSGFEERVAEPGAVVHLQCIFTGSPTPTVNWSFNGQTLSSSTIQQESVNSQENVVTTISIEHAKNEDGGVCSCHGRNTAGKTVHSARINVYGKLGSQRRTKITAVSGDSVALNCPFYGYPYSSVKWEKDQRPLPSNLRQKLMLNNSLVINELHRISDSGVYVCTAKHASEIVRSEVQLTVIVPPKLAPFSFQDELVREGMRGRLQCVVLEGDLPITLKWLKDGQPVAPSLGITIRDIDEFSSILTITSINPRHNGNYTCLARNPAATVTFTASLAVNGNPLFGYCFSSPANLTVCFPR